MKRWIKQINKYRMEWIWLTFKWINLFNKQISRCISKPNNFNNLKWISCIQEHFNHLRVMLIPGIQDISNSQLTICLDIRTCKWIRIIIVIIIILIIILITIIIIIVIIIEVISFETDKTIKETTGFQISNSSRTITIIFIRITTAILDIRTTIMTITIIILLFLTRSSSETTKGETDVLKILWRLKHF